MVRAGSTERVFNPFKIKLLRKRIPTVEVAFGAGFIVILALTVLWVLAQRDNYDPSERDISFAVLEEDSVEDTLYRTPLKRWREPGSAGPDSPALDLGIFPRRALSGGWGLDGRVETYDIENLYEKINGAADQYISFGFRALHYMTLGKDGHFVAVELYDMAEFPNALGIFVAQRDPDQRIKETGGTGNASFYPTGAGAIGVIGNYYFKISGDVSGPPVTTKALELVERFTELPAAGGGVALPYSILSAGLGLEIGQIAYERDNVFQYDFLSDFWFGRVSGNPEARYFIHESDDGDRARALFERLEEEQRNEYELVENEGSRVVMKHEYLGTFFAMDRNGRLVFGVEGAESREDARKSLTRLRGALRRGEKETDTAS